MKKLYKNTLDLNLTPDPVECRRNISKEIVRHADYMPKTLGYEDIDRCFKEWVENELNIEQDGVKLPTMVLYSNQRFSEYMQTWRFTDENNNVRLNFKTVTRENNPSHGSIVGDTYNIPGDRFYTFKSIDAIDDSGKRYRIDYKMKQPTAVDLSYKVSIITNRYVTLNKFNERIHQIFNSKQTYISPNGHYMSMLLDNISDESEYNIEDRQFFAQHFTVKLRGYILKEDDFKVEENPVAALVFINDNDGKRRKPTIEVSEYDPCLDDKNEYVKKIDIDIKFSFRAPCRGKINFTMDEDVIITGITFNEESNIVEDEITLFINNILITDDLFNNIKEKYIKCIDTPKDITIKNTLQCNEIPLSFQKGYKYIKFNDEYYYWYQIKFKKNDEIIMQTKNLKRMISIGSLTLNGYNKFIEITENGYFKDQTIEITSSKECFI